MSVFQVDGCRDIVQNLPHVLVATTMLFSLLSQQIVFMLKFFDSLQELLVCFLSHFFYRSINSSLVNTTYQIQNWTPTDDFSEGGPD